MISKFFMFFYLVLIPITSIKKDFMTVALGMIFFLKKKAQPRRTYRLYSLYIRRNRHPHCTPVMLHDEVT
jgi:hypothetical protein